MGAGAAPTGLRLLLNERRRVVLAGPDEASDEERDTFGALVTVLAHRRSLRPRLATTDRTRALVADIAARPLPDAEPAAVPEGGASVAAAMEALDYRHRIGGRPVAGDVLDPVDRIVARVARHVVDHQGEPWPDAALVAGVARRYRAVQPWPFAALTHPAPPGAPLAPGRIEPGAGRRAGNPLGDGHRPSWWRATPPWVPPGQPD